jgi:hypothetical protein
MPDPDDRRRAQPAGPADPARPRPLVACLCAAWCTTCEAYRPLIDALALSHPHWQTAWVDIEDQADALAGLPGGEPAIDNFPTLLVCSPDGRGFFGTVLPHASLLSRLLRQAEAGELPPLPPDALGLAAWLQPGRPG